MSDQQFLLLIAAAAGAGGIYLVAVRARRAAVWGLAEISGALLLVFALAVAVGSTLPPPDALTLRDLIPIVIAQNALFLLVTIYVVAVRYREPLARAGFTVKRLGAMAAIGIALALPIIGLSQFGGQWLTQQALAARMGEQRAAEYIKAEQAKNDVIRILGEARHPGQLALAIALLVVVVPLGEEAFFRGLVYTGLRARWHAAAAVAASAILFSLLHLQPVSLLSILLLGVGLALVYDRTGSLVPAIVVHAANNLLAVLNVYGGWNL